VLILNGETRTSACLYDSATGVWGDAVSTVARDTIDPPTPSILSGNALYWLFQGGDILVFDLERQTLGVIKKPAGNPYAPEQSVRMLRTDNGRGLGLAVLLRSCIQLWKRISNSDGLAEWELLQRTFQLEMLFPRAMNTGLVTTSLVGYDEDSNEIVLATCIGLFMVEVDSMLSRAISESKLCSICYPYRNFFTAGNMFVPCVTFIPVTIGMCSLYYCFCDLGSTRCVNLSCSFLCKSDLNNKLAMLFVLFYSSKLNLAQKYNYSSCRMTTSVLCL
jgi:hypothetical protein